MKKNMLKVFSIVLIICGIVSLQFKYSGVDTFIGLSKNIINIMIFTWTLIIIVLLYYMCAVLTLLMVEYLLLKFNKEKMYHSLTKLNNLTKIIPTLDYKFVNTSDHKIILVGIKDQLVKIIYLTTIILLTV